jgi:hypothetical protein
MGLTAPRSVILTAWMRSWRAGFVSYDDVLDEVRGPDADHFVEDDVADPVDLRAGLGAFSRLDPDDIWLVLPSPGDPRGLPGPGPFSDAALLAGEGILCGTVGLVPDVATNTSGSGDVWHTVTWRRAALTKPADPLVALHTVDPLVRARGGAPSVAEADHDLVLALQEATDLLRRLDVARWRPELATELGSLRRTAAATVLPPGYDDRCGRLVSRAATVARIVALAGTDTPGAAVTAHEASERDAALRPLATAARRAHTAAINAPLH